MVLFCFEGFVFFVFLWFYLGFYFVEFLSFTHQKKKKKSVCRLDMKNLAFGFKIIRSNKSEEFVLSIVCELYFSLCLIG